MTKVIYDSTKSSDLFYQTRVLVHDPVFFIDREGEKKIYLDSREFGVFKEQNSSIDVVLLDPIIKELSQTGGGIPLTHRLAFYIFESNNLLKDDVVVPTSFPLDIADFLRSKGVTLVPAPVLYPERTQKTEAEIENIRQALQGTTSAYRMVEEILKKSIVNSNDELVYEGAILTSEYLKQKIDAILLEKNLLNVEGMIVSSGPHAAMPHHMGSGSIKAHETIIVDLFPRDRTTGYFADMTRTYIKSGPSEDQRRMYDAVLAVQEKAISLVKPGARTREIYQMCVDEFIRLGFHAEGVGFIHGTGHGLGLDIHEEPYINMKSDTVLEIGNVITIEPGLYYPEWGGVRIEDVVVVTEDGCRNLTNYPKNFCIG